MQARQGHGGTDCKAQERTDFHRLADKSLERLATGILKQGRPVTDPVSRTGADQT